MWHWFTIMVIGVKSYGTLSVFFEIIWSNYKMNGMLSATTIKLVRVIDVSVTDDTLAVDLEDGRSISVPIGWYPRLAHGTPEEQVNFQISGAGYGIHWPDLDEDIGVEGLLLGKQSAESTASFARWLQRRQQSHPQ
jgi:hypothetical protein